MSHILPNRRDFIRTAAAGATALALTGTASAGTRTPVGFGKAKACIFINMVGGPAQLDTFDPKPDAPSEIRGPFRAIRTKAPGTYVSELFPKLAQVADKFSLIRSMHHDAPPVHECGFQLLNTGRLFRDGPDWPNMGAVVSCLNGAGPEGRNPWSVLPSPEVLTGINIGHGFTTGWLPECYSPNTFSSGMYCRPSKWHLSQAVGYVKHGSRFVTVNEFPTVFDAPSWDCHADGGSLRTNLNDIRDIVAPSFDDAFAHLLETLHEQGLLESTLVVATGEFGRTPKLNSNGGRDHWAGCWTTLVAGGGVRGGQVIGRSDRTGSEPAERPVTPQELVASIFHALGIDHDATIPGPDGTPVKVYPGVPVGELF